MCLLAVLQSQLHNGNPENQKVVDTLLERINIQDAGYKRTSLTLSTIQEESPARDVEVEVHPAEEEVPPGKR